MIQKTYQQKLLDPRWKSKRNEILERDNHTCQYCKGAMGSSVLNVHHKKYIWGLDPWEYDNIDLITFCFECHMMEETYKAELKAMIEYLHQQGVSHFDILECIKSEQNYLLKNRKYGQA